MPYFNPSQVTLSADAAQADLIPQSVVVPTPPDGIHGQLAHIDPRAPGGLPRGAIALIDLPQRRWSNSLAAALQAIVAHVVAAGAAGVVLLTNGPSGQAIALNAPAEKPVFPLPTACLAPVDAAPFLHAAYRRDAAVLHILGEGGLRPAFNVFGQRIHPNATKNIIVTTPRSGWFACAAERGPGIAIWLDLLRWVSRQDLPVNLVFSANTGHEYENLGVGHQIAVKLPPPDETTLWLHLGASIVTCTDQDLADSFIPHGSPSLERTCIVTERSAPVAHKAFANWSGWSDPTFATEFRTGEAGTAIQAGYENVIGLIGGNPLHHVRNDRGSLNDPRLIQRVAIACRELLKTTL